MMAVKRAFVNMNADDMMKGINVRGYSCGIWLCVGSIGHTFFLKLFLSMQHKVETT